jgi:hypothetical protein
MHRRTWGCANHPDAMHGPLFLPEWFVIFQVLTHGVMGDFKAGLSMNKRPSFRSCTPLNQWCHMHCIHKHLSRAQRSSAVHARIRGRRPAGLQPSTVCSLCDGDAQYEHVPTGVVGPGAGEKMWLWRSARYKATQRGGGCTDCRWEVQLRHNTRPAPQSSVASSRRHQPLLNETAR